MNAPNESAGRELPLLPNRDQGEAHVRKQGVEIREYLERLDEGDMQALRRLQSIVRSLLARAQAYDLQDDWDDIAQDVVIAVHSAYTKGRIHDMDALYGYLRSTTRFRLASRVRQKIRLKSHQSLSDTNEEDVAEPASDTDGGDAMGALVLLDEQRRKVVRAMYVEGWTQKEAATRTGIPLGSLKRYAQEGLQELRMRMMAL